jgi:hypothetical protein
MAIGVYFGNTGLNAEKYAECTRLLKKAGAGHPSGRSYHTSFGPVDKLMVFDVWANQAAFERFGKTLMPILQQLGVVPDPPQFMPIHNVIKPPAKTATKRASVKRSAARRKSKKL